MAIYYNGNETSRPDKAVQLEQIVRHDDPRGYTADEDLAAAVDVALILGKPLLVTGEPGTGKTELARHVAMALGLDEPERFDTRSTSQAMELFYRFDTLGRFHSASIAEGGRQAIHFVSFGPLGRAILLSLPTQHAAFTTLGIIHPGNGASGSRRGDPAPRRSVILIDEIDKAPRDFPNDLLDAIQNLRFGIRELEPQLLDLFRNGNGGSTDIAADDSFRPIVIITSNSEKNLPAPFLRRCVYYNISFPSEDRLRAIVARRIRDVTSGNQPTLTLLSEEALSKAGKVAATDAKPLLQSAVEFFASIRQESLSKPPATAELIDWVRYLLRAGARETQRLEDVRDLVNRSFGVLVKSDEDLRIVKELAAVRFMP